MRARQLKPEFFTDRKIASMGPVAALVYQALWVSADDGGAAFCDADRLKGQMFWAWDMVGVPEITEALQSLIESGRIRTYTIGDDAYCEIVHFAKHQSIHKPSSFRLPRASALYSVPIPAESAEDPGSGAEIPGTPHHLYSCTPVHLESYTPVHPSTDAEPEAVAERDSVVRLVVAANLGIAQHEDPKRRQIDPINSGSIASKDATAAILAAGVPMEFAEASIARIARVCEPNGRVNSLRYFTAAVVREWEERDGPITKRPRHASRFAPASDTTKAIIADMIAGKS